MAAIAACTSAVRISTGLPIIQIIVRKGGSASSIIGHSGGRKTKKAALKKVLKKVMAKKGTGKKAAVVKAAVKAISGKTGTGKKAAIVKVLKKTMAKASKKTALKKVLK